MISPQIVLSQNSLVGLFVLALPIASIAWTITHEEVFKEAREWFASRSKTGRPLALRKFFYLFTCEYCFSHWVTALVLVMTRYRLLYEDWRGYVVAGFALVWVANVYMGMFARLRLDIKHGKVEIAVAEADLDPDAVPVEGPVTRKQEKKPSLRVDR